MPIKNASGQEPDLSLLNLTLNQGASDLTGLDVLFSTEHLNATSFWPGGESASDQWPKDFSQILCQLQQPALPLQTTDTDSGVASITGADSVPVSELTADYGTEALQGSAPAQFLFPNQITTNLFAGHHSPTVTTGERTILRRVFQGEFLAENANGNVTANPTENNEPPVTAPAEFTLDRLLLTQSIPFAAQGVSTAVLPAADNGNLQFESTLDDQGSDDIPVLSAETDELSDETPLEVLAQLLSVVPQQQSALNSIRNVPEFSHVPEVASADSVTDLEPHARSEHAHSSFPEQASIDSIPNPSPEASVLTATPTLPPQLAPVTAPNTNKVEGETQSVTPSTGTQQPATVARVMQPLPAEPGLPEPTAIATSTATQINQSRPASNRGEDQSTLTGTQIPVQPNQPQAAVTDGTRYENNDRVQQPPTEAVTTVVTNTVPAPLEESGGDVVPSTRTSSDTTDAADPLRSPATLTMPPRSQLEDNTTTSVPSKQDTVSPNPEPLSALTTQESASGQLSPELTPTSERTKESQSRQTAISPAVSATAVHHPTPAQSDREPVATAIQTAVTTITGNLAEDSSPFQASTDDREPSAQPARSTSRTDGALETTALTSGPVEQTFGSQLQSTTLSQLQSSVLEQLTRQLVQQINLTEAEGVQKFQMRLDPEDLGEMVIEIHRNEKGELQIHVSADSPETRALIENQTKQIAGSLENQGVVLTEFNVLPNGADSSGENLQQQRHQQELDENQNSTTKPTDSKTASSSVKESPSDEISIHA